MFGGLDPRIYQSLLGVRLTGEHIDQRYYIVFFIDGYHSIIPG